MSKSPPPYGSLPVRNNPKYLKQPKKPFTVPPMRGVSSRPPIQRAFSPPKSMSPTPLLLNGNGGNKSLDSPVVRRAKRSGALSPPPATSNPPRKSTSLNNIIVDDLEKSNDPADFANDKKNPLNSETDLLIDSCEEYLRNQEVQELGKEGEERSIQTLEDNKEKAVNSPRYGTLPKSMKKNISRSLVPRMRRMFERARSCEPSDLVPAKSESLVVKNRSRKRSLTPNTFIAPTNPSASATSSSSMLEGSEAKSSDGTESVSSFVALPSDMTGEGSITSEDKDPLPTCTKESPQQKKSTGLEGGGSFMNKCVSKVKNIIQGSGDNSNDTGQQHVVKKKDE